MKLYIGGAYQGKTRYVTQQTGQTPVCCTPEQALNSPAINGFHLICRALLERGDDLNPYVTQLLSRNPHAIVVSDEIGLGIVPLDPFERRWREETGRALCRLSAASERVERISCGLGMRLK